MTELADATKKEIDDLTDKMQAELAEVKAEAKADFDDLWSQIDELGRGS